MDERSSTARNVRRFENPDEAYIEKLQTRIAELTAERRRDAIDGQAALEERDARIAELEKENAGLHRMIGSSSLFFRGYDKAIADVLALPLWQRRGSILRMVG